MQAASLGQVVSSHPWTVQYPPGWERSQILVPFGSQSAGVWQPSPTFLPQDATASADMSASTIVVTARFGIAARLLP